ncbi:MAG: hypothetical protein HUU20_10370 [Pirellulales bacterium]|nr:hypothetical protein [Pirellulales bacterium]
MVSTGISHAHLSEQPEEEIQPYRPVSGLAVAALVLGLLSLAAWIEPFLAVVSAIGILVGFGALRQIAGNASEMIGRKAALAGLCLSFFSLIGATAAWYTYRVMVRHEAKQFAQQWFDLVFSKQTHKAFDMTSDATSPPPAPPMVEGAPPLPAARSQPPGHEVYAGRDDVRALAAVGNRAQARYYQTEVQRRKDGGDELQQVYAVTYDNDGTKTTFFVRLKLERLIDEKKRSAYWQLKSSEAGIKPVALGGTLQS